MTLEQQQVRRWMQIGQQTCPLTPIEPEAKVQDLRLRLISEELTELARSTGYELEIVNGTITPFVETSRPVDLIEVSDALADLMVVVLGTAVAYGIDLEPIFQEVMRSNNTKFVNDLNGNPTAVKNHMGKILKPATYEPPNLKPIIDHQIANPLS